MLSAACAKLREQMPIAANWAYFDHAAVGPISGPAQRVLQTWSRQAAEQGDTVWPEWARAVEQTRRAAASLIGADPTEIALVPNTTLGIHFVAEGWPWQPGDNLVVPADEFPTNAYPWLNLASRGVETRRVQSNRPATVDVDQILAACDARTKIIAASWVGFASGWRLDLEELVERAHARGIAVLLDAIQGLGVFPLDVRATPVDFLAADGHKWLLGPEGAGLLYVRRERLEQLRPLGVGWHSVVHAHDFDQINPVWKGNAERYEGGSQNMAGQMALGASLELLAGVSLAEISRQVWKTTSEITARLINLGATLYSRREAEQHASGIVSFVLPTEDPQATRARCFEQQVAVSCRGGRIRLSPHAYQNADDLDRLFRALAAR
ncbi:MAG TPA: aminotransferase class V-fold PLP-dependent enzyme [Pirellulales bacterium]|jgi:selenocysteine lyase/cysteine desulfurase|nr:aminotransferase class V-fold PLP-dependent enzyme [Pirellulales bacterium]